MSANRNLLILFAGALLIAFISLAFNAAGPNELDVDIRLLSWLQGESWPVLEPLGNATNWLFDGLPVTIGLLAAIALLVIARYRFEASVLIAVALVRPLNGAIKNVVESPRPGPEFQHESFSGLGFPSGHTASAVLVCGVIAFLLTRKDRSRIQISLIWGLALAVVLVTGFGRMFVGAHWPTDVLGAILWSTAAVISIATIALEIRKLADP